MSQVVIVGAGFAGLSAARRLRAAGVDDVVVLEARDRVGGRTKRGQIAGIDIDLGGMWMGGSQHRLQALAEECGVETYPTWLGGNAVLRLAGKEVHSPGDDLEPLFSVTDKAQYLWLQHRMSTLSSDLDVNAPWEHPRAAELDRTTVESWADRNARSPRLRSLFRLLCLSLFCAEASQVSMLFFLHYVKSGDGLETLLSNGPGGAQNFTFHGGLNSIGRAMADELGDALHLERPVDRIEWSDDRVRVHSGSEAFEARSAIVAVPPTLLPRIDFDPFLPQPRQRLNQRLAMGSAIKYWVAYDRPFWRDQGFNGTVFRDDVPCSPCLDVTPPDSGVGLIAGFFDADHAIDHSDSGTEQRRELVVAMLAEHFGPEALTPLEYVDVDWSATRWSNGCYGNFAPPGVYADLGPWLRRPTGAIRWAGTETSPTWTGYVEGAIRSGETAAADVLGLLERMDDGTLRAWVSADPITLEEFQAIELPDNWFKNQPRESSIDGGNFLGSPGADGVTVYEEHFGHRWFHSATVVEVGVTVDDEGLLAGSLVEKAHEISFDPGSTAVTLVSPEGETYVRIGRDAGRSSDDPTLPAGWEIVEVELPDGYTTLLPEQALVIRSDNQDSFQGPVSGL